MSADGVEKSAILLMSLGEEAAASVYPIASRTSLLIWAMSSSLRGL